MSCGAEELLSEIPSPENQKLLAARLSAASCIYKCGGRVLGRAAKENNKVEMRKEARRDLVAVAPQTPLIYLWISTALFTGFIRRPPCYGCKL